jgi:FKBP-type peptidyl-prolyl cis-trans isomerase 2
MKKTLGIWLIVSLAILAGCAKQYDTYLPLDVSPENMTCVQAVKDYLAAADMKGNGAGVKQGDAIVVDYIGRLEDGTVFDTSVESIAQACGKYSAQRDYSAWLPFTVGAGQMIAGFDAAVVGMKAGQTKTIKIPTAEAYGERDESYLVPVAKNSFSGADTLQPGEQVMTSQWQTFTVYSLDEENIVLDANPPLAGKDLIFDITIKTIN